MAWLQEFYIRRLDGQPISSAAERQRVIQRLQAAIERRASEVLHVAEYLPFPFPRTEYLSFHSLFRRTEYLLSLPSMPRHPEKRKEKSTQFPPSPHNSTFHEVSFHPTFFHLTAKCVCLAEIPLLITRSLLKQGVRLELSIKDRRGLLAYVTRVFRENSLSVTHAEITTRGDKALNVFHVTDVAGRPADPKAIDEVIHGIGTESLRVDEERWPRLCSTQGDAGRDGGAGGGLFSLGSLVKKNLYNLGLIRSCS